MVNIFAKITLICIMQRIFCQLSCPDGSVKCPIIWGTDFDDKWYAAMPASNRYNSSMIDDVILIDPDILYEI